MRFYDVEEWLGGLRWYHWLGLLGGLCAAAAGADALGWLPAPPPEGYHPAP